MNQEETGCEILGKASSLNAVSGIALLVLCGHDFLNFLGRQANLSASKKRPPDRHASMRCARRMMTIMPLPDVGAFYTMSRHPLTGKQK